MAHAAGRSGAIDYVEDRGAPFVVAINNVPGSNQFDDATVREALAPGRPMLRRDARDRSHASSR